VKLWLIAAIAVAGPALAQAPSLNGVWKTVSDRNGEAESLIRITEADGRFEGTVIRVFSPPAASANPRCELCAGELKDQPIVGMKILRGQRRGELSGEGEVLDPDEGKVYRCTVTLTDGGSRLEVRGYVGISLFGRTQVWLRAE
jgi:uncharacterized protein (DUF2147 family)